MLQTVEQLVEATKSLSVEEQFRLFDALWGMIDEYAAPEDFSLTPEQRAELDRRREAHRLHPESAINWEEGKSKLAALRAKP